ncbi:MAG: hypothetical protein EBS90_12940 [Betaproteobacteria bacterium]|nr:hypothetical protein [Betaproteobacteria bacterium]
MKFMPGISAERAEEIRQEILFGEGGEKLAGRLIPANEAARKNDRLIRDGEKVPTPDFFKNSR